MPAAAILDFYNFEILAVETPKRAKLHQHAKFRGDQSNRRRDMAILQLLVHRFHRLQKRFALCYWTTVLSVCLSVSLTILSVCPVLSLCL